MVTGVGGGVGQSILKGLNLAEERRNDVTYRTVGVDADPAASGLFRVDVGYRVPFANADGYVDRLVEVAMKEEVDILVPGSDPEVAVVAENREELAEAGEMEVLVSPPEAVEIGRDKWETYNFLTEHGFKTPNTVLEEDANELVADVGFPLVVKPRTGSASRGLYIVTNQAELDYALGQSAEAVVQEYLIPENWDDNLDKSDLKRQIDEYSSETIVDRDGDIVSTLANWREMDKGVPSVAKVRPHNDVREVCELVVEELDVLGPINLQSRVTSEGVSFFEINTRFTGSTAVRCTAGFNGPDAMVRHLVFGDELSESDLEFENLVEMRYKDEVYVSEEKFEEIKNTGSVVGGGDVQDYY
jgi:carbamoyl-phosphate synthase large subunit